MAAGGLSSPAKKAHDELGQKGEGVSFLVAGRMVGSGGH